MKEEKKKTIKRKRSSCNLNIYFDWFYFFALQQNTQERRNKMFEYAPEQFCRVLL